MIYDNKSVNIVPNKFIKFNEVFQSIKNMQKNIILIWILIYQFIHLSLTKDLKGICDKLIRKI